MKPHVEIVLLKMEWSSMLHCAFCSPFLVKWTQLQIFFLSIQRKTNGQGQRWAKSLVTFGRSRLNNTLQYNS